MALVCIADIKGAGPLTIPADAFKMTIEGVEYIVTQSPEKVRRVGEPTNGVG